MKLISWNVNGLRAVLRKSFLEFLDAEKPDVLCLQETKCTPDDVEQLWPARYTTYWNCAARKGYSGTAIFTKSLIGLWFLGASRLNLHLNGLVVAWQRQDATRQDHDQSQPQPLSCGA